MYPLDLSSLSLPVTKVILSLSYGSQGLSGGRWASQRRLRSSEDSRRRARRGGGRLAAMRATDRHIGAAQVLRRPRPAVQWLQVWASGIRAPRRAQHGRAACAAAKLGPPVKDDGQRYARQKNLPSTQDLETPSMGRSEPYNGEAAGGMALGNEPTPSPHEATRVPSSRCVRVLCVKLTSYRRLATPRCMCPHLLLFFNPDEYVVFLDAFKISNLQAPVLYMLQKSSSSRQTTRV